MSEVPLFSECVIGYRQWQVQDWVLAPIARGKPWKPGVNKARCQPAPPMYPITLYSTSSSMLPAPIPDRHAAPAKDCHCGLYATHEPPTPPQAQLMSMSNYVTGAIAAWGDLQVHHGGFRAEYAQIVCIVDDRTGISDHVDLAEVARFYGVPLVPRDMLVMEAERHGRAIPEAMRPAEPEDPYAAQLRALTAGFSSFTWSTTGSGQVLVSGGWSEPLPARRSSWRWWKSPAVICNGAAGLLNAGFFVAGPNPWSLGGIAGSAVAGIIFAQRERRRRGSA